MSLAQVIARFASTAASRSRNAAYTPGASRSRSRRRPRRS